MKRFFRLISSAVIVGILVVACYKLFIVKVGDSMKENFNTMFEISGDSNRVAEKFRDSETFAGEIFRDIEKSAENEDDADWNVEDATPEVFDGLTEVIPIPEKIKNWVDENIFKR